MATYYFRNSGTAWTTAANWSLTSGGPGDGAVPTSSDDVIFNSNSGNCTIPSNSSCKSITTTGYSNLITSTGTLNVHGNISIGSASNFTTGGTYRINANSSITSNGYVFTILQINAASVTFLDLINCGQLSIIISTTLSGSFGFVVNSFIASIANGTITLTGGITYVVNSLIGLSTATNSTQPIVLTAASSCNLHLFGTSECYYCNPTNINSSAANTVFTWRGTITSSSNWISSTGGSIETASTYIGQY